MNGKIQVDSTVIKILYYKYKEYIIPVVVFLLSWGLFFLLILPQFQTFFAQKDQIAASEQTLAVVSENYNAVVSFPNNSLQQSLDTANEALPSVKDFVGILTAISNAAGIAGITVNDYSFNIGDLNNTPGIPAAEQKITIDLTLNGTLEQSKKFVVALSNQLPLSQVTSFTQQNDNAMAISADFYYSPLPKFSIDPTVPLSMLTASQKKLLEQLGNIGTVSAPSSASAALRLPTSGDTVTKTPVSSPAAL